MDRTYPSRCIFTAAAATLIAAGLASPAAAAHYSSGESVRVDVTVENQAGLELSQVAVTVDSPLLAEPLALLTDRRGEAEARVPVDPDVGGQVTVQVEDESLGWVTVVDDHAEAGDRIDVTYVMDDPLAFMRFDSGCNAPPEGECGGGFPGLFRFDALDDTEENEAGFANDKLAIAADPAHFDGDIPVAIVYNYLPEHPTTYQWTEAPFLSEDITYPDFTGDGLQDVVMWDTRADAATRVWTYSPASGHDDEWEIGGPGGDFAFTEVAGEHAGVWSSGRFTSCRSGQMEYYFPDRNDTEQYDLDAGEVPPYCMYPPGRVGADAFPGDFDDDGAQHTLYTTGAPGPLGIPFLIEFATGEWEAFHLGNADAYLYPELADITGDGAPDVFVSASIPGVTNRWWVWESDHGRIEVVDVGTRGEVIFDDTLLDGDRDGLPELLGAFYVDGVSRGWEVYEYASGDYFEVILGPEDDRGPSSIHYPEEWL